MEELSNSPLVHCTLANKRRGAKHGNMDKKLPDEISIKWCLEDVKSVAEDLTNDECRQVLQLLVSEHDAEVGVNWDTIRYWAGQVKEGRKHDN